MKLCAWLPAAALMFATSACGGSTPSAPTQSVALPQPSPSEVQRWNFNVELVSITGDSGCLVSLRSAELTGTAFSNVPTTIERSGSSMKIASPLFSEFFGFSTITGTIVGADFTATGALGSGGSSWTCSDGTMVRQQSGTARIMGSFSTDAQQLSATDVHVYPLVSGGQMNYNWSWMGSRN